MADVQIQLNQTDNGKYLEITDVTTWADPANTGVTHVLITITYDSVIYTVKDVDVTQPAASTDLYWEIPATDVGFANTDPFEDGIYTVDITYTTSPASDPVNAQVFLDWNAKYYDYTMVKNLPYALEDNQFAFNKEVEQNMVFNTLVRGAQFSASVGQLTKCNDILAMIEKFKLSN